MKKPKVASVRIAFHVHATEEEERVISALRNVLPDGIRVNLVREVHYGYYGNPIVRYEGLIKDSKVATKVFWHILRNVKGFTYPGWIEERFDEKEQSLYIRLDKQAAFLGELKLGQEDVIHMVFKFHGYVKLQKRELEEIIEKEREKSGSE